MENLSVHKSVVGHLPTISIGMPVYNGGEFLRFALLSALNQTFGDFELIISDNASTDATSDVISQCVGNDPRVSAFRQSENIGGSDNFRFVFEKARGRYFLWLAADDIWNPEYLEALLAAHQTADQVVLAFPEVVGIDESNKAQRDYPAIFALNGKDNLLHRMQTFLWSEESEGKANLIYGLFDREALAGFIAEVGLMPSYGFGDWGVDNLFVFGMGLIGQYVGTHGATLYKRNREGVRYDKEGFHDHFREMHGYFQGYRALIQVSTLSDSDKDFLLSSLAVRESVWYARLLGCGSEPSLKPRLDAVLGLPPSAQAEAPAVTSRTAGAVQTDVAQRTSHRVGDRLHEPSSATQLVGVVFSKDRPLQLDGTLRSFFLHCQDPDDIVLKVLYTTSSQEMESAYRQIEQEYPGVVFVREHGFKRELLGQIQGFDQVLFVVDDTIFVRDFHLGYCVRILGEYPDAIGFSLRLGTNTTYCYPLDRVQRLPPFQTVDDNAVIFNWTIAEYDFNYPIEVSSSIYRLRDVQPLLERLDYKNPNTLESVLSQCAPKFAASLPHLLSVPCSAAFTVPVNKVQDFNDNRAGAHQEYSASRLAALYRDGYRLDAVIYSGFTPNSCHQEVELKLTRDSVLRPSVSIIIPCYKQAEFLVESVGSVLAQTLEDWECLIIDDGSPDNTSKVAQQLMTADPRGRIRLIERSNGGLASARNAGVRAARGRYILPLDADDMLHPDYLSETVAALELNPDYAIVYVDEQNFGNASHVHRKGQATLPALMSANVHDYCSLYRKEVWAAVGGYSPAMYLGGEDWNFWLSAAERGFRSLHLSKPLFLYRNRENTMVAETLANLKEVWAHIVFHHLELYNNEQKQEARLVLGMSPTQNQSKLKSVLEKHPLNRRLQFLMGMAEGADRSGQPLVSVIVPTHNRPDLLMRALHSIREQTYQEIEIVIVNDAGVDVQNIADWVGRGANVSYVRHSVNRGLAATRNTGLRVARGEIIAYLDDDDVFLPNHVASLVHALRHGSTLFVYTESEHVLESAEHGQMKEQGRARLYGDLHYSKERLHIGNYIPVNTWGHWKSTLEQTGYFDEGLDNHEDWDFLLRCSRAFDLVHIPKVTVQVHQRAKADNMLRRERHKFYDTYQLIYSRYDDLGNPKVAEGRRVMLEQLLIPGGAADTSATAKEMREGNAGAQDRDAQEYATWRSKRSLQEIDAQVFAEHMMLQWKQRPLFNIVVNMTSGQEAYLADTLDSLAAQLYTGWQLVVIAPMRAPDPAFEDSDNLRWIEKPTDASIEPLLNEILDSMEESWLLMLPSGTRLEPHMLIRCGDYVNQNPGWRLVYWDDDNIDAAGEYSEPRFKPDFNLDYLRSTDYIGPCMVRTDALLRAGGGSSLRGAEEYDTILRIVDSYGEKAIGHIADVLLHLPAGWEKVDEASCRQAVVEHLSRSGICGEVVEGYVPYTHRVVYDRPSNPLVTVIIPNRDKLEFLQPCVESLFEKTSYGYYEVIVVDNQSTDPDVLEYYEDLQKRYPNKVRVLSYDAPFNFSAMNNLAVSESSGEYLILLNNDTQIVQGDWMERMLSYGQRPEVGIVGARLAYPESGKIQHAGVVLGMSAIADHPFNEVLSLNDPGYMNRAQVDQNYSAVTAACMLVRKSLYEQVEGMDEANLKVLFNDVDLCLKVGQAGYKVVWTPFATVVHHGSTSIKGEAIDLMKLALGNERAKSERGAMMKRWLPRLANDPAYNRHLSFQAPGYRVEETVVIDWDTSFHDRPRILASPLSGGSGEYRVIGPFRALSRAGLAQCDVIQMGQMFKTRVLQPVEVERAKPDTLVLQAAIDDMQLGAMELYKQYNSDVLRVFTLDDLLTQVPKQNSFYRYSYKDSKPRLRKALALCDRAIVTTEPLAELCRPMIGDVRVIPNRLERALWGDLKSLRRQGAKPRVGWAGAQQHAGDLALMADVIKATAQEVDWVFFGMCPEELRPYVREFHDFVLSFHEYPAKLASLNLDLAVAPLEINPFNEAKSNLRLLEYGMMGWPVVCTDIYPYQNAPVKRVANEAQAWIDAIRERVTDLDAAEREGDQLRNWVLRHHILEDHLDEWLRALVR